MKQVIQNYKTGELSVMDVAAPVVPGGGALVRTLSSLISAGTERTKVETANMSIVEKAFSRLDLVKILVTNIKQEGLFFTLKKAMNKLDTPISLGYSCSGVVLEQGQGFDAAKTGARVACVGEKYAAHAELNAVPGRFLVPVPDVVSDEEAAFVGVGAIALNAVRVAQARTGETVAVIGLGLIGQIVIQILKANGCRVLGLELDSDKLALAKHLGLDGGIDPRTDDTDAMVRAATGGTGVDAVIIAAASRNSLPIEIAGRISRDKGRVILVGAMPIVIPRGDYYEKELPFIIARGFGADLYYVPEKDRRYPYGYTPADTRANMSEFLDLVARRKVDVQSLISHRFPLGAAADAYNMVRYNTEPYLGILFSYGGSAHAEPTVPAPLPRMEQITVGFLGAGSFAQGYIIPPLKKDARVALGAVCTSAGMTAANASKKFGFMRSGTDPAVVLDDPAISTVFVMTRHNLHARQIAETLGRGKRVFVEKPLCTTPAELKDIIAAYRARAGASLMIGFNRRFSPFMQEARRFFANRTAPLMMHYRVNAGFLPASHWAQDAIEGGGRIVGEMCHFIDVFQYLANSVPVRVSAAAAPAPADPSAADNVAATITFADGSVGTLLYSSLGDASAPRERLEAFGDGSVAVVDNYTTASFTRCGSTRRLRRFSRDMGHTNEINCYIDSIAAGDPSPIPFEQIVAATLTTFKMIESVAHNGMPVPVEVASWLS